MCFFNYINTFVLQALRTQKGVRPDTSFREPMSQVDKMDLETSSYNIGWQSTNRYVYRRGKLAVVTEHQEDVLFGVAFRLQMVSSKMES